MYGWNWEHGRDNWVTKIIKALEEGKELNLVDDTYTQPTYAGDVAEFIWDVMENGTFENTYNVSSGEKINLYEFGKDIARIFELNGTILKAKLREFKGIAPRPSDTCFRGVIAKLHNFNNIKEGLKKMKDENT